MNEKYQLYYYWNHGMCDQCGAPILILNEALSYEGNDQQELQAFLDEHAECRYFSNKDEPVSYTHLDVYKRQSHYSVTNEDMASLH